MGLELVGSEEAWEPLLCMASSNLGPAGVLSLHKLSRSALLSVLPCRCQPLLGEKLSHAARQIWSSQAVLISSQAVCKVCALVK